MEELKELGSQRYDSKQDHALKALEILATYNAILLLRDAN